MMLGLPKLLLLLVLAWLAWRVYKRWQTQRLSLPKTQKPGQPPASSSEDMVRCRQCQVFFPASQAIYAQGDSFCCEAHRKQFLSDT